MEELGTNPALYVSNESPGWILEEDSMKLHYKETSNGF